MITTDLWQVYLPGEPPEGCSYRMFVAAREFAWREEDKEYNLERLQELRELWAGADNVEFKKLLQLEAEQIKEGL